MAITGINDSAREHEQYQRRLHELGERYAENVEKQKDRYGQNIDELAKQQSRTVGSIKEEKDRSLADQRAEQERAMSRISDRFEKQSHNDAKIAYDRFGRSAEENFRTQQHLKNERNEQIEKLAQGQEKLVGNLKRSQDEQLFKLRQQQENEKFRVDNESGEKLEKMAESYKKQSKNDSKEFTKKLDSERQLNFEEQRSNKMLSALQLEQFKNQRDNEVKNLQNSFSLRERQLIDEKDLQDNKLRQTGTESLDTYRNRLSDNLSKVQADNNYENAKKDIGHANTLARLNSDSKMREQEARLNMDRAVGDAKYSNEARENKQKMDADLTRRRELHTNHLTQESTKSAYEDTISELNAEHSQNLQVQKQNVQNQFDEIKHTAQKRIEKIEKERAEGDLSKTMKDQESQRNSTAQHLSERHRIASAYEQKQKALENNVKRNNETQTEYFQNENVRRYRDTETKVSQANIENMDKMYRQRVQLEGINEIQAKEYKYNVSSLEDQQNLRMKMTAALNAGNIQELQKIHELQLAEYKRSMENQMAKAHADADSTLKNTMFDFEYRIKTMAQGYEQKIAEMEMKQTREMNAIKQDHERASRSVTAQHRNDLEIMQENNKKALALQEGQYKDRMRIQDENQKAELARYRHSNEILRMKS